MTVTELVIKALEANGQLKRVAIAHGERAFLSKAELAVWLKADVEREELDQAPNVVGLACDLYYGLLDETDWEEVANRFWWATMGTEVFI